MAERTSAPTRQRAEVDWNRGADGPQASALLPVGPPTRALLGNLPAQADGLILDLACGAGSPTFEAARRFSHALPLRLRSYGVERTLDYRTHTADDVGRFDVIVDTVGCWARRHRTRPGRAQALLARAPQIAPIVR